MLSCRAPFALVLDRVSPFFILWFLTWSLHSSYIGSRHGLSILHTLPCYFFVVFFFILPGKVDDNGLCYFVSELLVSRRIGPDFGKSVERKPCMHFNICV